MFLVVVLGWVGWLATFQIKQENHVSIIVCEHFWLQMPNYLGALFWVVVLGWVGWLATFQIKQINHDSSIFCEHSWLEMLEFYVGC